jgi:hypothetical protein
VVVDFNAALSHRLDKLIVLPLGAFHPQDIVKKQLIVIAGGQALQAEVWPVNDHFMKLANFRMNTKFITHFIFSFWI